MDKSKITPQSNKIKILVNTTVGTAKWLLPGEGRVQRRVPWQWLRPVPPFHFDMPTLPGGAELPRRPPPLFSVRLP